MLKYGTAIHIKPHDFKSYKTYVSDIVNEIEVQKSSIDIFVDLYRINASLDMGLYINLVNDIIKNLNGFRRIVFAASSFPDNLAGRKQGSISTIDRLEWGIWKSLVEDFNVDFGDYAADDPLDVSLTDGATIIPTVRYTNGDYWYIARGKYNSEAPRDFTQFHELSKAIIERKDIYCGENYSWGDKKIFECAKKECVDEGCNHGNLESWVKISTNHHLTYVANQTSNLFAASSKI